MLETASKMSIRATSKIERYLKRYKKSSEKWYREWYQHPPVRRVWRGGGGPQGGRPAPPSHCRTRTCSPAIAFSVQRCYCGTVGAVSAISLLPAAVRPSISRPGRPGSAVSTCNISPLHRWKLWKLGDNQTKKNGGKFICRQKAAVQLFQYHKNFWMFWF